MQIDASKLRRHRIRAGLFQTRLAELSGVDRTVISMIENGRRLGTPAQCKALADALGVDMDDLTSEAVA